MIIRETAGEMAIDFEIYMSGGNVELLGVKAKQDVLELYQKYHMDTLVRLWGLPQETIIQLVKDIRNETN